MLNKIILSHINQSTSLNTEAMNNDVFESPATYKGWIYPLRFLLALRYQKQKQKVLEWFRLNKIYPVPENEFRSAIIQKLSGNNLSAPLDNESLQTQQKKSPFFAFIFKPLLVYPVFLAVLLFGLYNLNDWYQERRISNVLANHLPYYSDLLHRKLLLKHNDGNSSLLKKIEDSLDEEQKKILSDLPERDGIRDLMKLQLEKLKDSAVSSEDIMLGFKAVNTLFDAKGLPYYLTPKSFSMPCSSLIDAPVEQMMMLKKLEELMSNNNPERCRTTMMTVYKVNKRNRLMYTEKTGNKQSVELPLFHVKRIDKVPAVDSALGLTFKDRGIGSIILTERIKNFSQGSVLPALTFQGRNYIIPFWMQGYYEIEEAVTRGYQKDLDDIYTDKAERRKVKTIVKKIIKNKSRMQNSKMEKTLEQTSAFNEKSVFGNGLDAISVFLNKDKANKNKDKEKSKIKPDELELLKKLDDVLLPSIELHEAYHQIDKKDWKTPSWIKDTFKDELSEGGIEHTMEELGAYLSQLADTEQGHNIWLSKLLIFSLNPMTKGQAEFYASSIILKTMESLYLGKPIDVSYNASVDEKTLIYKTLITKDKKEIKELAKRAFEALFEREVPNLH